MTESTMLEFCELFTLKNLIKEFDIVVGALPGFMGYKVMERVIKCGKNIVDKLDSSKYLGIVLINDLGIDTPLSINKI